jgi:hypothetical protein
MHGTIDRVWVYLQLARDRLGEFHVVYLVELCIRLCMIQLLVDHPSLKPT